LKRTATDLDNRKGHQKGLLIGFKKVSKGPQAIPTVGTILTP